MIKIRKINFIHFWRIFSQIIGVNKEKLIITNFGKLKIFTLLYFLFKSDFILSKTKEEIITLFIKQKLPEIKSFNKFKEEFLFKSISLNKLMLDIRGNNKDNNFLGCYEARERENNYPPVRWHKYGLKVVDEYDNGNND